MVKLGQNNIWLEIYYLHGKIKIMCTIFVLKI